MSADLLQRVKSSLNKQYYTMNHSWLSECVDYYVSEHQNPTQDEIISFVTLQWNLNDLRDINNENGCLPKNLANQKCITLPGKYILQVDKMYDISTSKYKQLEKIRNVSSENIEATENENKTQEDKFQTWEPKSKRMLQLFLTDGVQDILGIEYKTIRFLKECKEPGFKVMIKGPVICRRGVLLLEENNVEEKGGEVESLLVKNALENVLARALNLEENPDPWNDANRQQQGSESTQKTAEIDDDFDFDTQALDQIEKQAQQQSTNACKNSTTSNLSHKQSQSSLSEFNYSYQAPNVSNQTLKSNTSSARNQPFNSGSSTNNKKGSKTQQSNKERMIVDFDDEGDSFFEMIDDSAFKTPSVSKASTVQSKVVAKQTVSLKSKEDEFPTDDEICDLTDSHSSFVSSTKPKSQSTTAKISSQKKDSSSITTSYSSKHVYNQKQIKADKEISSSNLKENSSIASSFKNTSKMASQNKNNFVATPSISDIDNLDHNLDLNDIDFDGFDDYDDVNSKNNLKNSKSTEVSASSSPRKKTRTAFERDSSFELNTNSAVSTDETYFEDEFHEDLYERCRKNLLKVKKSSQDTTKSLPKSNNEQSATTSTSQINKPSSAKLSDTTSTSQINKPSSAKLSDRLRIDNKSKDNYNIINKAEEKNYRSSEVSSGSLFKWKNTERTTEHSALSTNKSSSTKPKVESQHSYENLDADFGNDFDIEFEAKMEVDHKPVAQQTQKQTLDRDKITGFSTTKSQDSADNNSDAKSSGSKRPASLMSPSVSSRPKLRCLESTPKDKTNSKKITDFFEKPKPKLLNYFSLYEAICDVLEMSRDKDKVRSVVRGKVINCVKLNLLKNEIGSYFHLDATITDGTANLDVVFCSEVLEEIVGYSVQEFILKRKQAKADPKIKEEMRDDLMKAQSILRVMDAMMEIELKKNEKARIIAVKLLSKEERKQADERLQQHKAERNRHK